jgi:hypothetical protein
MPKKKRGEGKQKLVTVVQKYRNMRARSWTDNFSWKRRMEIFLFLF